jgi:hypothetical protein
MLILAIRPIVLNHHMLLLTVNFRQPRVLVMHWFDYDLQLTRH